MTVIILTPVEKMKLDSISTTFGLMIFKTSWSKSQMSINYNVRLDTRGNFVIIWIVKCQKDGSNGRMV